MYTHTHTHTHTLTHTHTHTSVCVRASVWLCMYGRCRCDDYIHVLYSLCRRPAPITAQSCGAACTRARGRHTDETLRVAAALWFDDNAAAVARYGPIGDWDTRDVTSMRDLFEHL